MAEKTWTVYLAHMNGDEHRSAASADFPDRDDEYVVAELIEEPSEATPAPSGPRFPLRRPNRGRRIKLPAILFLLTCLSTFWAGVGGWYALPDGMLVRRLIISHWQDGLTYMACLLAILLTHEMGHFLGTLRYGIPASLPFFIPFPISPIGTMGAVIGMDGRRADRKQMFDIGLAGPLAGLAVAVPILLIGIHTLNSAGPGHGPYRLDLPLAVRSILAWYPPAGYDASAAPVGEIWYSHLNPFFMAGWVGLLITGLNMLPVSQLDGGHVLYALFGRRSRWVARGFMLGAIAYLIATGTWGRWMVMILLVLLIGISHPPTRDDSVKLGWLRVGLGLVSLAIPLLCLPPQVLHIVD